MPAEWLITAAGGRRTASGQDVTPTTSMALSAYFACQRNISEDFAKFPFKLFREESGGRRAYMAKHPVNRLLLIEPNPEMTPMAFWEALCHWAMGWGKGCAEIERNGVGRPVAMWPIHPSRIQLVRDDSGKLVWRVYNDKRYRSEPTYIPDEDMFHLHGMGDGLVGYSVAQIGATSISRALAAQVYSEAIFGGGGTDRVALRFPGQLSDNAKHNLRESWRQLYGGADNSGVAVLDRGVEPTRIGIPPKDAEMLETARFTVEDIARWFRCPTSKVQHWLQAKGWSTLDAENKDYVFDTLTPWFMRAEQEANRKLLSGSEDAYYTKHIINFLLFATPQERANYLQTRLQNGTLSQNEWRRLEDEDGIGPDGDTYWIAGNNMVPLDAAIKNAEKKDEKKDEPAQPPTVPPPQPETQQPEDDPGYNDDPEQDGNAEDEPMSAARSAAWDVASSEFSRAVRKEAKACMAATRKHLLRGDVAGWTAWLDDYFDKWPAEMAEMVDPAMRIFCILDGRDPARGSILWQRHAVSSRAQLLGVYRDGGTNGVMARLEQWPDMRKLEVNDVTSNDNAVVGVG